LGLDAEEEGDLDLDAEEEGDLDLVPFLRVLFLGDII
jgi:hypothetical protein